MIFSFSSDVCNYTLLLFFTHNPILNTSPLIVDVVACMAVSRQQTAIPNGSPKLRFGGLLTQIHTTFIRRTAVLML
jgi:hypothetical protein